MSVGNALAGGTSNSTLALTMGRFANSVVVLKVQVLSGLDWLGLESRPKQRTGMHLALCR